MQRDLAVCCGDAAGQGLALRGCSGRICGFLPGGLPLPDSSPAGYRLTNRPAFRQRAA